ncbi:MAG: glycosyltransferase family 2 protein [Gemmatimonadota bacterium]|jgi:glycosyltransferase involved in cell wall biosynthesis|nr:glycosyltransferase family 2 protein [Gemmatimonadota bacterium]MDQ8167699.1 glycosyltransferase family 2 protein [Gemmatimonadota bacterium]MDQ8172660.1 glycosyltransferase family 2 protein [Gemmatimonadota bacterium]
MTAAISLLIATYNWPRALELVLASVRAQRVMPDEVVIADDGSRDDTRALLVREARTFPCPLVHVWHDDTGFRLAAIRNKAIARARGNYIVQIDGDILLHPAFVASHLRAARRGRYVQGSRALLSEALTRRMLQGESVTLGVHTRGLENRPNALYAPWLSPLVRGATDALRRTRGCHMAFWRDDLVRVNGYDEHIEGWGREDSELATRLINAGVRRRNLKFSAVAYHLWHTTANQDAVNRNHERVVRAQRERLVRADCGLDQYLDQYLGQPLASPESNA